MDSEEIGRISEKLARFEIVELMWRYSRAVDRHDLALLESLFWPDCEINYTNLFNGDRAQFLAWVNPHHEDSYINHQHHTTAHIVDIDSDTASGEHYCIVFLQRSDGSILLSSGRYLQQFEKRGGEWRILVREFVPEISSPALTGGTSRITTTPSSLKEFYSLSGQELAPGQWAPFPPSGPGRWDDKDLAYRRPLGRRAERDDIAMWTDPD